MPDEWWRDLPRLQRGLYQRMLIECVWASMVPRVSDGEIPEWSAWMLWSDMSELFRCSVDQVRDDARNAKERGMIAIQEQRGKVRFQILWQKWGGIKSYQAPRPVVVVKPEKTIRWLSRAVTVEPGKTFDLPRLDFPVERIS